VINENLSKAEIWALCRKHMARKELGAAPRNPNAVTPRNLMGLRSFNRSLQFLLEAIRRHFGARERHSLRLLVST
jgi:hypothetical protein